MRSKSWPERTLLLLQRFAPFSTLCLHADSLLLAFHYLLHLSPLHLTHARKQWKFHILDALGRLWGWGKVGTVKDNYANRVKPTIENPAGFLFSTFFR